MTGGGCVAWLLLIKGGTQRDVGLGKPVLLNFYAVYAPSSASPFCLTLRGICTGLGKPLLLDFTGHVPGVGKPVLFNFYAACMPFGLGADPFFGVNAPGHLHHQQRLLWCWYAGA